MVNLLIDIFNFLDKYFKVVLLILIIIFLFIQYHSQRSSYSIAINEGDVYILDTRRGIIYNVDKDGEIFAIDLPHGGVWKINKQN